MDRISKRTIFHPTMVRCSKFGEKGSTPIDQQPVAKFNIDPLTGRPLSDMTAILRAQGLEQRQLLSSLQEYKSEFLPDDISDDEALKYYQPRLCQLPSELAELSERITDQRIKEQQDKDLFEAEEAERKKQLELEDQKKKAEAKELEVLRAKVKALESNK